MNSRFIAISNPLSHAAPLLPKNCIDDGSEYNEYNEGDN